MARPHLSSACVYQKAPRLQPARCPRADVLCGAQEKAKSVAELREELFKREAESKEKAKGLGAPGSVAESVASASDAPPRVITDKQDADDIVAADMDSSDEWAAPPPPSLASCASAPARMTCVGPPRRDSDDDEDETAELMKELERIKREREEDAAKKVAQERALEEEERQDAMLRGNPLMAGGAGFGVKRRWDDDVVFRNQARDEAKPKKQFINDTIRNDFHRKFLHKYVQ